MIKFIKNLFNKEDNKLSIIDKKLEELENKYSNQQKLVNNILFYNSIGILYHKDEYNSDKRIKLLIEANSRGYFGENNIFNSIKGNKSEYFYKHMFSNIESNYRYYEDSDELRIPVIGVGNNFSTGCICIYQNGIWSEIKKSS